MATKYLVKQIFQRKTADFIEFLEIFSDSSIEVAVYYLNPKVYEQDSSRGLGIVLLLAALILHEKPKEATVAIYEVV